MSAVISKLDDVDPAFREVMAALYPELDPRELWDISKMNDSSEVNVPSNPGPSKKKKLAILGGLGVGLGADAVGVKATVPGAIKAVRSVAPKVKTAEGLSGKLSAFKPALRPAGEAGLTGVNLATGVAAGAMLMKKPKQQNGISKSLAMIVQARRDHVISTDRALELVDEICKGPQFFDAAAYAAKAASKGKLSAKKLAEGDRMVQATSAAALRGRRAISAGMAGTAAIVGAKKGHQHVQEQAVRAVFGKSDTVEYGFTGEISKVNSDKRLVFGFCSLSTVDGKPVIDLQNDYIALEEIEKAAYDYVCNSRKGGVMHARVGDQPLHVADMVESMVVTPEKLRSLGVPDENISKMNTGWWCGFRVNDDDVWAKVKRGELAGFSVHGKGSRLEAMIDDV